MDNNIQKKLFFSFAFCCLVLPVCAALAQQVTPPKKIEYDGMELTYNPAWRDQETYLEADLDNDPENEIIISFVSMYKTEPERKEEKNVPYVREKKELLPIYNYVFYQIYDFGPDKNYAPVRTYTGMDRPGSVIIFPVEEEKTPAIAFISPGGDTYKEIRVIQWQDGGYRQILSADTRGEVTIDPEKFPGEIITKEEKYVWDVSGKTFEKADKIQKI